MRVLFKYIMASRFLAMPKQNQSKKMISIRWMQKLKVKF